MKRIKRMAGIVALACAAFVGTSAGACGGGTGAPGPTGLDLSDVIYAGAATDEALTAMLLAGEPGLVPAQAAVVDAPADGATVPRDVPPTISWHVQGSSASRVGPSRNRFGTAASSLAAWLGPREAWAHGAPVNGRAYLLLFSNPKGASLLRVFTTDLSFTFDAGTWTQLRLASAGDPVSLVVSNAIFEDNRVAQDGGPFAGEKVTFWIGP